MVLGWAVAAAPARGQIVVGQAELYGVNSGDGGQFLAKINKLTGKVTIIGTTGITIDGLAFSPAGELFAADNSNRRLVTLNPLTGAIDRVIGSYGVLVTVEGLAFRPTDGALFAIDVSNSKLARLDLSTGALTYIGILGVNSMAGLTFSQDGSVLYALGHSTGGLYTLDLKTGLATLVGTGAAGGTGGPLGMATDPETGLLYVAEWRSGSSMTLATVAPLTGTRTFVGTMTGGLQIEGLAFSPVPEPSTNLLLGAGSILLAIFRIKRRWQR